MVEVAIRGGAACVSLALCAVLVAQAASESDELRLWDSQATYNVESALFFNDVATNDKEVGYKLRTSLTLRPYWRASRDHLLQLQLRTPVLTVRGKGAHSDFHEHPSHWDAYQDKPFYAHFKNGLIDAFYLDHEEDAQFTEYLKSIVSLFQFQALEGEYVETDISGTCHAHYETLSQHVLRKIKKQCAWPEAGAANDTAEAGSELSSARITRYELGSHADSPRLRVVFAEEAHVLRLVPHSPMGLRARAWHRLDLAAAEPAAAPRAAPTLRDALRLAEEEGARPLARHRLAPQMTPADAAAPTAREVEAAGAAVLAAEAGTRGAAEAHLGLVEVLRRADTATARRLLDHAADTHPARLGALCDALAGAGTAAAHAAARAFLHLEGEPLLALAERYLSALPAAHLAHEAVAGDVLRLAQSGRLPAELERVALLSAAAMAARLPPRAVAPVKDHLGRALAKCKSAECRAAALRALANLRHADTLPLLLEHAWRPGTEPATVALRALRALHPHLRPEHLRRLRHVALGLGPAPRALQVRAAALHVLLDAASFRAHLTATSLLPLRLDDLAREFHASGQLELSRVLWARLTDLAERQQAVRHLVRVLLAARPGMAAWAERARLATGTSGAVRRPLGGQATTGRELWLESEQLAEAGVLRRATVLLGARSALHESHDLLELEVTTRRLEALVGGADEDEQEAGAEGEAGPGAWLALSVAGERRRPLALFASQGELLGHVWAGTASEPTEVLSETRVLRAAPPARLPLLTGAALVWQARSALALRLDGQVQVSLWNRVASALVELRTGVVAELSLEAQGAGLRQAGGAPGGARLAVRATVAGGAEPKLSVHADLDFYERPTLCVRPHLHDYTYQHEVRLRERLAAAGHRVARTRHVRLRAGGATLALDADNERACRNMHAL